MENNIGKLVLIKRASKADRDLLGIVLTTKWREADGESLYKVYWFYDSLETFVLGQFVREWHENAKQFS